MKYVPPRPAKAQTGPVRHIIDLGLLAGADTFTLDAGLTQLLTDMLACLGDIDGLAYTQTPSAIGAGERIAAAERQVMRGLENQPLALLERCSWSPLAGLRFAAPRGLEKFSQRRAETAATYQLIGHAFYPDLLTKVSAILGTGHPALRQKAIFTAPDTRGTCQRYAHARHIEARLALIFDMLQKPPASAETRLWYAIWILVAMLNLHPLRDGNGRLARFLFNHALHRYGLLTGALVPLGPLIVASHGFFETCASQMQLHHKGDMMIRYFHSTLSFYRDFLLSELAGQGRNAAAAAHANR